MVLAPADPNMFCGAHPERLDGRIHDKLSVISSCQQRLHFQKYKTYVNLPAYAVHLKFYEPTQGVGLWPVIQKRFNREPKRSRFPQGKAHRSCEQKNSRHSAATHTHEKSLSCQPHRFEYGSFFLEYLYELSPGTT